MQMTFQVTRFQVPMSLFAHLTFNSGICFLLLLPSIISIQLFIYLNDSCTVSLRVSSTCPSTQIVPSSALN